MRMCGGLCQGSGEEIANENYLYYNPFSKVSNMKNPFTKKHNDTPDLAGLKEFAKSPDRDSARFFVGRREVLDEIDTAWQRRMNQWDTGNKDVFKSSTRIVQGAPGAGKTSVGTRLAKEMWNPDHPDYMFGKDREKAPHVVRLNAKTPNKFLNVFRNICEVIKPDVQGMFETTRTKSIGQSGSADALVVKGELTRATTDQFKQDAADMEWSHLRQVLGDIRWTRPVCLLIDEAQNMDKPGIELLAGIHDGTHQLPIFPLLLGLGNTEIKLLEGGISRLESTAIHTLPALTKVEVEEICDRYFATYRIKGTSDRKNEIATALHTWSSGWPAHMHNALLGLTKELLKTNGDLASVYQKTILAHGQGYRDRYYRARLGTVFNKSPAFLGEFMTGLNTEKMIPAGDIDRLIEDAQKRASEDFLDKRIGTHSVEDLFNHLLHQGFIQPDNVGDYVCPIPSLRRWCLARAGMADPLEKIFEENPAN